MILYNNAINIVLYVNGVKTHHFKVKNSEIKPFSLCLENISKDLPVDNMKNCVEWKEVFNFSLTYEIINVNDISQLLDEKTQYCTNA